MYNVRSIKKKSSYLDCAILMLWLVQNTIFAYSDFFLFDRTVSFNKKKSFLTMPHLSHVPI
jgi:hypothetical protein